MDNRNDSDDFFIETDSAILEISNMQKEQESLPEAEELLSSEPPMPAEELPELDLSFEFEEEMPQEKEIDDEELANISTNLASQVKGEYEEDEDEPERRVPVGLIIAAVAVFAVLALMFFFIGTDTGRKMLLDTSFGKSLVSSAIGDLFEDETNYADGTTPGPVTEVPQPTEGVSTLTPGPTMPATGDTDITPTPDITEPPVVTEPVEEPQTVYNFLLLGIEDEPEVEGQPKTDLIMLATVDTKTGALHLTTILRDLLVQIPGYTDNTISSVYSQAGILVLYETMEKNLGIRPDGYLLVDYQGFREMVDLLGGVTVELTTKEAAYLNKTNYISLPENRNVVAGENHLNGDQVLGYCRIRHVETENKEYNDIGRTTRQRKVLYTIFQQLREQNVTDAYQLLKKCLSYVTTDITGDECTAYLEEFLNMPMVEFTEYRLPMEGTYQTNVVRKVSVLVADMPANREALLQLLYPEREDESDAEGLETAQ
ncbi:MAG: LCP family protein [Lachnospiraceae bacterium]|nr:LCP family protein [Lachnospiraceae bacterium]